MALLCQTSHVVASGWFASTVQKESFKKKRLCPLLATCAGPEKEIVLGKPKRQSMSPVRCESSHSRALRIAGGQTSLNGKKGIDSPAYKMWSSLNVDAATQTEVDAADVVCAYYDAVNKRDLAAAMECFAPDCVLEDMIYTEPFRGKQVITEYFRKFFDEIPLELVFVIDKISRGNPAATGLTWHCELNGKSFPFSRGCSFYECDIRDGKLCITYGRDIPEPASKPGGSALVVIHSVVWLAKTFPFVANTLAKV